MFHFLFSFLLITSIPAFAQNAVEELSKGEAPAPNVSADLFTETVTTISPSKKVFILTNKSGQLGKGDFISLVMDNSLVCRAIVAKTTDKPEAGIKIIKIYSLKNWNKLREAKDVQIIRGDDSYFNKAKEVAEAPKEKAEDKSLIASEDDLYNESVLLNDGDFEENSKRIIKPDNIFGISLGQVQSFDAEGTSKNYPHFMGSWSYQIMDNIWAEGTFGQTSISDFPDAGKSTKVTNLIVRFKYTFAAPFSSYILPYVGYQHQAVDSPDAGVKTDEQTDEDLDEEIRLIDKTARSQFAVGATILKRLVPGWFVKVNLGIDIIDAGISLEF